MVSLRTSCTHTGDRPGCSGARNTAVGVEPEPGGADRRQLPIGEMGREDRGRACRRRAGRRNGRSRRPPCGRARRCRDRSRTERPRWGYSRAGAAEIVPGLARDGLRLGLATCSGKAAADIGERGPVRRQQRADVRSERRAESARALGPERAGEARTAAQRDQQARERRSVASERERSTRFRTGGAVRREEPIRQICGRWRRCRQNVTRILPKTLRPSSRSRPSAKSASGIYRVDHRRHAVRHLVQRLAHVARSGSRTSRRCGIAAGRAASGSWCVDTPEVEPQVTSRPPRLRHSSEPFQVSAPDMLEHHVDALALGELAHLALEALGAVVDDVIGAERLAPSRPSRRRRRS